MFITIDVFRSKSPEQPLSANEFFEDAAKLTLEELKTEYLSNLADVNVNNISYYIDYGIIFNSGMCVYTNLTRTEIIEHIRIEKSRTSVDNFYLKKQIKNRP